MPFLPYGVKVPHPNNNPEMAEHFSKWGLTRDLKWWEEGGGGIEETILLVNLYLLYKNCLGGGG